MVQMRCQNCKRPLKNSESQARGMGPSCWAKIHPKLIITNIVDVGQKRLEEWI